MFQPRGHAMLQIFVDLSASLYFMCTNKYIDTFFKSLFGHDFTSFIVDFCVFFFLNKPLYKYLVCKPCTQYRVLLLIEYLPLANTTTLNSSANLSFSYSLKTFRLSGIFITFEPKESLEIEVY